MGKFLECYGFLANILYFDIYTPLEAFIKSESNLRSYIERARKLLDY